MHGRGGELSTLHSGHFTPGEITHGTHQIGGWVASTSSLDIVKRKVFYLCWEAKSDSSVIQPMIQLLYQLSKPRHFNKIKKSVFKVIISYTLCASCFSFPMLAVHALQTAVIIVGNWCMLMRAFNRYISFLLNNDDKVPDTNNGQQNCDLQVNMDQVYAGQLFTSCIHQVLSLSELKHKNPSQLQFVTKPGTFNKSHHLIP